MYGTAPLLVNLFAEGMRAGAAQRELPEGVEFEGLPAGRAARDRAAHRAAGDDHHEPRRAARGRVLAARRPGLRRALLESWTRRETVRPCVQRADARTDSSPAAQRPGPRARGRLPRAPRSARPATSSRRGRTPAGPPPPPTGRRPRPRRSGGRRRGRARAARSRATRGSRRCDGTPARSCQATPSNFSRLGQLRGEPRGDLLLVVGQELHAETAGLLHRASVREVSAKHTIISGGSSESEETALAVMPLGPSGPSDGHHADAGREVPACGPEFVRSIGPPWPESSAKTHGPCRQSLESGGREKPSGADPFAAVMCERASRIVEAAPEAVKLVRAAPPDRRRTPL